MKITRKQLRRLIKESMLTPTFWLNKADRENFIPKVLADPDVHPKIKDLLQTGEESSMKSGLELLRTLNPDYEEEIATYFESHQDTFEYHQEFENQRDNYFFMQIESLVEPYKNRTDVEVENLSSDTSAGTYTKPGSKMKHYSKRRLHGAEILTKDRATLEEIASELDNIGNYVGVRGYGTPLVDQINSYYVTAFDSSLKYKNEMHKKGKYSLRVYPAQSDTRIKY